MVEVQKRRTSELRYRRLFEAAQDGILILDVETGAITDVNPFLIKILEYSRAELTGKNSRKLERSRRLKPAKKLSKHSRRINIFVTKTCRLILPDATQDVTGERAKLICQLAQKLSLHFEGQRLAAVTLSLAVAVFPDQGATSTAILRAVDAALYHAKHGGRGRVVVAGQKARPRYAARFT